MHGSRRRDPARSCRRVRRQAERRSAVGVGADRQRSRWPTLVDWLIGRPLEALLILLVAWVRRAVARRLIRRAIFRVVVADRDPAARALRPGRCRPPRGHRRGSPPLGAGDLDRHRRLVDRVGADLGARHPARPRPARARPGPADRRRRDRRHRPRLRRPEPGQGLHHRAVHADRGPVRHRRRRRPRGGQRHASSGSRCAPPCCAARTARCGTSRTARSGGSATARSCGRSPCSTSSSPTTPTSPATREVVHAVAEELVEDDGFAGDVLGRARAARRGVGDARRRRPAAARAGPTRAPSSGCSGRCARRSRAPSTTPAWTSCRHRRGSRRAPRSGDDDGAGDDDSPRRDPRGSIERRATPCHDDRRVGPTSGRGVIGLLAFFTRPDGGPLLVVDPAAPGHAGPAVLRRRSPPARRASWRRRSSAELGAESPAVASLLTNGFVVTPARRRRHAARPRRPGLAAHRAHRARGRRCSPTAAVARVTPSRATSNRCSTTSTG